MPDVNLEAACQLFDTEVTLQYQNRLKLQDTIEERHGLHGTALNVPVSDLVEINPTNFAPTDIFVTPVNETNDAIPTNNYHFKMIIGGEKVLQKFLLILGSQKNLWAHLDIPRNTWKDGKDKTATDDSVPLLIQGLLTCCNK